MNRSPRSTASLRNSIRGGTGFSLSIRAQRGLLSSSMRVNVFSNPRTRPLQELCLVSLRATGAPGPRIHRVAIDNRGFVSSLEHAPVPLARHVRTQVGALHFEIVAHVQLRILELDLVRRGLDLRAVKRKARFAFPAPIRRSIQRQLEAPAVPRRVALPLRHVPPP